MANWCVIIETWNGGRLLGHTSRSFEANWLTIARAGFAAFKVWAKPAQPGERVTVTIRRDL